MAYNRDAPPRAILLLTRPRAASDRFAAEVAARALPVEIVVAPLMDIVDLAFAPHPGGTAALIFTSAHGIPAAGPGDGRRAWCVGPRTTEAARAAGFDAVLAGATADELVARLEAEHPAGPLVHLHGRHQRGDVADRLAEAGLGVTAHAVYDQVECAPGPDFRDALRRAPLIVPLFSPRSAALFVAAAGPDWHPRPGDSLIALSAAVRSALPEDWAGHILVADRPDGASMLDAVTRLIFA